MPEKSQKPRDLSVLLLKVIAIVFALSIPASFVMETALPLWQAGRTLEFILNLVGFPIIFVGTGVFVWSAFLFLRAYFAILPDILTAGAAVRDATSPSERAALRRANLAMLWREFRTPSLWFAAGAGLILLGGLTINAAKILGYDTLF